MSSPLGVVVIGDSNSEGTGATSVSLRWQQVLQGLLRERLQPVGVSGAAVPYITASPRTVPALADYPLTTSGSPGQSSFGLGLRAATVASGQSVTFTFAGTRARLLGSKGPSVGRYGIRLDGAAEVVVDGFSAGSVLSGQVIWDSGPLSAGAHTVLVQRSPTTTSSPGNVFPEGLLTYNADESAGVRVVDAARHGATVGTFTGSSSWQAAFTAVGGKQLLIMPWGANDSTAGTSAAAFRAGVEAIITAARSAGFDGTVLLPKMPKRGTADPVVWADYLAQLDGVADALPDVVTVDMRSRIPDQGTPEAIAQGLYVDEVHFSDVGQALIAEVLAEAILAAGEDDPTLGVRVEAAFGADQTADPDTWSWTDLSSRVLAEPIRIRAGRSGGARYVSPSTCTVTLDNADGALTPANPMSPYWPDVNLGTPLRVRVSRHFMWRERFAGFADQWQPTFLPSATPGEVHSVARVTASGILRRLGQGNPPVRSAMRRTIAASGPVAYWPAEDGVLAEQAGAELAGNGPLVMAGTVDFQSAAEYDSRGLQYGTSRLGDISPGGSLSARLSAAATAATIGAQTVHTFGSFELASASGDIVLLEWTTPKGTYTRWQLVLRKTTVHTQVIAYTAAGAATTAVDVEGVLGGFRTWAVSAVQAGGNITVTYRGANDGDLHTGSIPGTLAGVESVTVNPTRVTSTDPEPFGHVAVWATPALPYPADLVTDAYGTLVFPALASHWNEAAHLRLARLCAEDGVPLALIPPLAEDAVQRMGWQEPGAALDLYRECEDVDGGILYEQGFSLAYLPRAYRYNRPVDLSVDLAQYRVAAGDQGNVLTPVYDDQTIRNELTVSRVEGSSVVVADEASQQRHGVYSDSVELNLATDTQLPDQASWRLHLAGGEV